MYLFLSITLHYLKIIKRVELSILSCCYCLRNAYEIDNFSGYHFFDNNIEVN